MQEFGVSVENSEEYDSTEDEDVIGIDDADGDDDDRPSWRSISFERFVEWAFSNKK